MKYTTEIELPDDDLKEVGKRLGSLLAVERITFADIFRLKERLEIEADPKVRADLKDDLEQCEQRAAKIAAEVARLRLVVETAPKLTEEQRQDAARLKAIYEARKADNPSLTQESLAAACGWKTQSAVTQYLNAMVPLNLDALIKFALALDVRIEDISPTLASRILSVCPSPKSAAEGLSAEAIDVAKKFDKLTSPAQRAAVNAQLDAFLNP